MKPLQLGDMEIQRVEEFMWPIGYDLLFPHLSEADFARHRDWLVPRFTTADSRMLLSVHTFVIRTRHHTVLVDTCVGNEKERERADFHRLHTDYLDRLGAAGVTPDQVDYVFCTHFHSDHVGWNTRLEKGRWVPTFPRAKYLFHRPEFEHFMNLPDDEKPAAVLDSVVPIAEAGQAEVVDGDHSIGDGIYLEPTPGHTPGHCSVHLSSSAGEAVITGDLMHHPIQFAEPQWTTQVCTYPEQAVQTRKAFIEKYADTDTLILGTHFAPPTACRIIRRGESYRPRY